MSLVGFLILIVVGAICGAIAEMIVGYSPGGFLASVAIGFVGAVIGSWLAPRIGLPEIFAFTVEGFTIPIVWAILGAVLLLLILSMVRRPYRRRRRVY
jgi:uncharacterized membrane protein YeaQ/YmgE (transglycosylase-associated protein family)